VPDALLYKSTALEVNLFSPAVIVMTHNLLHRKHKQHQATSLNHTSPTHNSPNRNPSTHREKLELLAPPPAKMATFPTDVAANSLRATLS
jgi:hypothetical protein